jgi:hypothetical protein
MSNCHHHMDWSDSESHRTILRPKYDAHSQIRTVDIDADVFRKSVEMLRDTARRRKISGF